MSNNCICEGRYCFDFSKSIKAYKGDSPTLSGLGGVDFIVELENKILFIEIKDLENKKVPKEQRIEWIKKLSIVKENSFLIDLGIKFKDTIIRNWAQNIDFTKPIDYIVILQLKSLDAAMRLKLSEGLDGRLPTAIKEKYGFIKVLQIKKKEIITIDDWDKKYPQFPVSEALNLS